MRKSPHGSLDSRGAAELELALLSTPRRSAQKMSTVIMAGFVTVDCLHLTISKRESEQITSSDCGNDIVSHTLPSYLFTMPSEESCASTRQVHPYAYNIAYNVYSLCALRIDNEWSERIARLCLTVETNESEKEPPHEK